MVQLLQLSPRRLKRLVLGTSILVLLWLIASFIVATVALQRKHPIFAEPAPDITWGKVDSFRLTTADGEELGAWFIANPDAKYKMPVVLLLHGHNGRRGDCLAQAKIFADAGCPLMLITQRAHGDSTGEFNDVGYSARKDVLAAVAWLEKNHADRPIVIYGQSMGAASALFAAAELGRKVHGYILESPYKDLRTAVANRTRYYLPMVADQTAYAGLVSVAPIVLPCLDSIAPIEAASHMPDLIPVLVLAGSADRRARPEEARAICAKIPDQARLVVIEGGDHGGLMRADPEAYRAALQEFVERWRK
jgi:pimeloyl-ACP methyl ester carboxylesterase